MSISILGQSDATVASLAAYVAVRDRFSPRALEYVIELFHQAKRHGIVPEGLVFQSAHETGWWRFGGVVPASFNNPGGLKVRSGGADDDPHAHIQFQSIADGALAMAQHLAHYAGVEVPLEGDPLLTQRTVWVPRGSARTFADLGGRWAPSLEYGQRVEALIRRYRAERTNRPLGPHDIPALVDITMLLPSSATGGPRGRLPLARRPRIVVHHAGGAIDQRRSALRIWRAFARNHMSPGRFHSTAQGNGIMYNVGIDQWGGAYMLYDLEAERWHSGDQTVNATALSLSFPFGHTQHATHAQLTGAVDFIESYRAISGMRREDLTGHLEWSPTACPGTLMGDLVYPYRMGTPIGTDMTEYRFYPETGFGVGHGFLRFFDQHGGVRVFGYPLSEEFTIADANAPDGRRVVQVFERYVMSHHPEAPLEWHVQGFRLGADELQALREREITDD